jgi:hypothetical protein
VATTFFVSFFEFFDTQSVSIVYKHDLLLSPIEKQAININKSLKKYKLSKFEVDKKIRVSNGKVVEAV